MLFHPLIHIGFALTMNESRFVADGLAYLCYAYEAHEILPIPTTSNQNTDPALTFEKMRSYKNCCSFTSVPNFMDRTDIIHSTPELRQAIKQLASEFDATEPLKATTNILDTVIAIFGAFPNGEDFLIAHAITASFACYEIIQYLRDVQVQRQLLQYLMLGLLYVYSAQGFPEFPRLTATTDIEVEQREYRWNCLREQARKLTDVHVVKVIYALNRVYVDMDRHDLEFLKVAEELVSHAEQPGKWSWNFAPVATQRDPLQA